MRHLWHMIVAVCGLLLAGATLAAPVDPSAADREAIRQVIGDQMAAFRRDDGAAAFSFASPMIQAMFGTPERFIEMVRGGYPAVYRPREVAFQTLRVVEGEIIQPVTLVGPDGVPVVAIYKMEWQDGEKVWRINGCFLAQSGDKGA